MITSSNAILIKDNKILIGKRPEDKKVYAGLWDVFGGHLKGDETPEDAMKREVKEELGIEIIDYKFFYLMKNDVDPTSKRVYNHYFFVAIKWNGEIKKENLNEIKVLKWITKEELDGLEFSPSLKEVLKNVLKQR